MAKINQEELAKRLNLSQTTISRSLANHPAINADTKALVLETAAKLGYNQRIKRSSHDTSSTHQNILGVLISMPKQHSGPTETFQEVLRGIADKSTFHDSILDVVYHDPNNNNPAQLIRRIKTSKWNGAILIYPVERSLAHEIAHVAACVSIVENYRHDLIDSVDVDQSDGIISLVTKLKQCGHKRIGFMTWVYSVTTPWVMHRFGSYVEGLYMNGLDFNPSQVINVRPGEALDPHACATRVRDLVKSGVTAIVCPADHQAYQLIQDLEKLGLTVPDDVSLTGFDGIPPPLRYKQLATVKVAYEELGRSAVHQLLRRMEQPSAPRRHILVDGDVVQGRTIRDLTA